MSTITFADLAAIAIDVEDLPPMQGRKTQDARRSDRKRTAAAKRETVARKQARVLSGKGV